MGVRIEVFENLTTKMKSFNMGIMKGGLIKLGYFLIIVAPFLYSMTTTDLEANKEITKKLMRGRIVARITRLPNSNTYKCQAMGIIYAPIDKVWKVLSDYNHFKDFMPNISEGFIVNPDAIRKIKENEVSDWSEFEKELMKFRLEQIEDNTLYFYNRFNLPWPLKDRYYILKIERIPEKYTFHWTQFIGNTKVNNGSWELMPFKGSKLKTLAIYTLYTDPGLSVSSSLMHIAMKVSLPGTIKAVRKRVLELILEERKNARIQSANNF